MRTVRQTTQDENELVCRLLPLHATANFKGLTQVADDGTLEVIVGYDDWMPNSVQMHLWVHPRAQITRQMIREAFRYAFLIGGPRDVAIGVTPCDNEAALEVNRRLGFVETYRVKDGWLPGTDLAIQELRREQCHWIREFLH